MILFNIVVAILLDGGALRRHCPLALRRHCPLDAAPLPPLN